MKTRHEIGDKVFNFETMIQYNNKNGITFHFRKNDVWEYCIVDRGSMWLTYLQNEQDFLNSIVPDISLEEFEIRLKLKRMGYENIYI